MKLPNLIAILQNMGFACLRNKEDNGDIRYDLYYSTRPMPEDAGSMYYATIYLTPNNKKYLHNGIIYATADELLAGIDEYNKHTEFPYWIYDPSCRNGVFEERAIRCYLNKLGFVHENAQGGYNIYVFIEPTTKAVLYRVFIKPDYFYASYSSDDTVSPDSKGGIIEVTTDNGMGSISVRYEDYDSAIRVVSTILQPLVLNFEIKILNLLYNFKGIDNDKLEELLYSKIDLNSLQISRIPFKQYIINQLETTLEQLKNSSNE